MNRTEVSRALVETLSTPLKRPFVTSLGRRARTVNVGITILLRGGARGYGEASTSLAFKAFTAPILRCALERLAQGAVGRDVRDWRRLVENAWNRGHAPAPAAAAFETALLSSLAAEAGVAPASWFGGAKVRLETDLTLSAWNDTAMTEEAAFEAAREGFKVLKIKVGGPLNKDLSRVRAARRGAPRARLILDGNQGFSPRGALRLLEAVRREGATVDLLEQPVRKEDLAGMAFVARRAGVPVAADESVTTPQEALFVLRRGAATAVNIKLAKSGLSRSLEIASICRAAGAPLMIGCMAETARGLAASVHFALGTGAFRFVDLDSDVLLDEPPDARRAAGWLRRGPAVFLPLGLVNEP